MAIFRKQKKVLIVDDEEKIRETLSMIFTRWGFMVFTAEDGREALEQAHLNSPDLVILDIKIPELDGYEVCKALKENPETRNFKVIMITGLGKPAEIDKGFFCGADDYIIKPIDWNRFKIKVSKLMKMNIH